MATPALAGDVAAGKALYGVCIACHGSAGEGNTVVNAPALAGQSAPYLVRQLTHFKAGRRGGEGDTLAAPMRGVAATLADSQAIENVAAYIAGLPATVADDADSGDARRGGSLYNGNCGACHGGRAQGNPVLNAPRLAGLDATYIQRQLANYRNGIRGNHPDDRLGRQMAMMATTLTDPRAIDDVITYIQQVGR